METQTTILDWFIPMMFIITVVTILFTMFVRKYVADKLHINDKSKFNRAIAWVIFFQTGSMIVSVIIELIRLRQ